MYVIIFGNLHTGVYRVTGPFSEMSEAQRWAQVNDVPTDFSIIKPVMPVDDVKWGDKA